MFKTCLSVFIFSLICKEAFAIFGGATANWSKFPKENLFVSVSVIKLDVTWSNGKRSICSATMVSEDIALTAAHCVLNAKSITAQGLNGIEFVAAMYAISNGYKVVSGPQVGGFKDTDIAMIGFNKTTIPKGFVSMPMEYNPKLVENETVFVAGFGTDNPSLKTGAGSLRYAEVKILENKISETKFYLNQTFGSGAAHGDSGGPVLKAINGRFFVVGVLTAQMGNAAEFFEVDKLENLSFGGWNFF